MEELNTILDRLRQHADLVDVDELLADVQRGKQLIDFCNKKITGAKLQINEILDKIEQTGEEARQPAADDANALTSDDSWQDSDPPHISHGTREDIPF